jgi:PAS domain S-box-containing protein
MGNGGTEIERGEPGGVGLGDSTAQRERGNEAEPGDSQRLLQSERRFRIAFERSPVGKSLTTIDGGLRVNQAFCDLVGYTAAELEVRRWQDVTHPDDIAMTEDAIARLVDGGEETLRFEKRYLHKSGRTIWCEVVTALHRDEHGNSDFFLTSVLDITERKHMEVELAHLNLVLRAIRDVNHLIAREKDAKKLIARACQILAETRGYTSAWIALIDDAGQYVQGASAQLGDAFPLLDARLRERKLGACASALDRAGVHVIVDPARQCPGCPALPHYEKQAAMAVRLEHDGRVFGLLVVAVAAELAALAQEQGLAQELADDIAYALHGLEVERQRQLGEVALRESEARYRANLEHAVADRTRELGETNREMEAFSYSVSHDLRAPLRAVDGFTRILLDEHGQELSAEGRRICTIIRGNTERMGHLIDDLLALSRLGRAEMQPCEVDMSALARAVFEEMVATESRPSIDFRLGELPVVHSDRSLMRQVWQNLIGNAIKFSSKRERALIEVSGEVAAGEIVYSVRDNGAGYDPRYAHKLFGVFERLHSAHEFEGTGVGLALVKQIIRRHGGRVWAEGAIDQGATFHFALPRKET